MVYGFDATARRYMRLARIIASDDDFKTTARGRKPPGCGDMQLFGLSADGPIKSINRQAPIG